MEERQERADKDELSTVECPLFILDNTSTTEKIAEWGRIQNSNRQFAVQRDDYRVEVILNSKMDIFALQK